FQAASTRDIAARAGVNQGLITYYFKNKQALWKAAAGRMLDQLGEALQQQLEDRDAADGRARARERIREYGRFVAAHPQLLRLMVEEGKHADARMRWLVDTHLRPLYERFARLAGDSLGLERAFLPHAFYAMAGAASMIFAIRPECRRLTGLDPADEQVIETHAEFMAPLLGPQSAGAVRKL